MYVHWRTLIVLGFLFWIIMCFTDGFSNRTYKSQIVNMGPLPEPLPDHSFRYVNPAHINNLKYLSSFLTWNFVTFSVSFCMCAFLRKVTRNFYQVYYCFQNDSPLLPIKTSEIKERHSASKIPVLMSKSSIRLLKTEDEDIIKLREAESSCPNLLTGKSQVNKPFCHTIFKNNTMYSSRLRTRTEYSLESKCAKLREEILQLQTNSMKDHAILTRQLDAVMKEKKELSKQLATAQKENRAAKQQLEELIQEKYLLHQRLDNATQEFRNNTKSKKIALAKLEQVTGNVDNLKVKLEQVTRDKEIFENKLTILQDEYEKLQERVTNNEKKTPSRIQLEEPERDSNIQSLEPQIFLEPQEIKLSLSKTELDMQKVQIKIDRLEEDLKNFNPQSSISNLEHLEEDGQSVWNTEHSSGNEFENDEDDKSLPRSEEPVESAPETVSDDSPRYWSSNESGKNCVKKNIVTRSYSCLDSTRDSSSPYSNGETSDTINDDLLDENPKSRRIVSNSVAFQKFLKNLNQTERRNNYFSISAVNFNDKFQL